MQSRDQRSRSGGAPVLVVDPERGLDVKTLLAATDDSLLARRRIPPGAVWHYADVPVRPSIRVEQERLFEFPDNLNVIQFAVGGRIYPPIARWVKLTERFRGRVVRYRAGQVTGDPKATYLNLTESQRDELSLLSGKDAQGAPLQQHRHAFFILWPDGVGIGKPGLVFAASPPTV